MQSISRRWVQATVLSMVCAGAALALAVLSMETAAETALEEDPEPAPEADVAAAPTPRALPEEAPPPAAASAPAANADTLKRLDALLERFEALEQRMSAVEGRAPQVQAHEVGQVIEAPVVTAAGGAEAAALVQVSARLAAIEARMRALDPQRFKKLDRKLGKLQRRFKKAEAKVKVSQLSVDAQVDLAVQSPLGRELLRKIDELEDKLDAVLSKRMVTASSYSNLIPGLWGTYYADRYLTERAGVRVDARLDFDWNRDGPAVLNGQKDDFSIRWEGVLRITEPGTYSFYTVSDDGVRFWLGEQLVLAEYDDHKPQEDVVDVVLEVGDYPLRVEYYENGGRAVARLLWKFGGRDRGAIPAESLFHLLEHERM